MRGIIWSEDKGKGFDLMESMIQKYELMNYNITKKGITFFEVENGDRWDMRSPSSARGYRANVSYIDKNINQEVVDQIIRPQTSAHPWSAIAYF